MESGEGFNEAPHLNSNDVELVQDLTHSFGHTSNANLKVAYDYVIPACTSMLLHPLVYARTMMMLGYEPDPPKLRPVLYTLVDGSYRRYVFPNIFIYLRRIREEIGLANLFTTGLPASILGAYTKSFVTEKFMERVTDDASRKSFYVTDQGVRVFLIQTSKFTAARVLGVTISYPFQVIMVRQMAEFVGSDGSYNNLLLAFFRISKSEGLGGLFSGLVPRLLGEVLTVWLISSFVYILNNYVFAEKLDPSLKQYSPMVAAMMASNSSHSLTVVSTVTSISGSKLELAIPYRNWWECYRYLSERGCLGRGSSLFFRYAPPSYIG